MEGFARFDPRRGQDRAWLSGIAARVFARHCEQSAGGAQRLLRPGLDGDRERPPATGPDGGAGDGRGYRPSVMLAAVARARWAAARAMPADRPVWLAGSSRRPTVAASRWVVTRGSRARASANVVSPARAAS